MDILRRRRSSRTILARIFSIFVISVICTVMLGFGQIATVSALTSASYTSDDQDTWTMGYSRNTNGMTLGSQGTNGWYCLYTTQTNRNGSFNTGQMKEASYGKCKSNWKYYGVNKTWTPGEYLSGSYDAGENSNWWIMDGNGRIDPHVSKGQMMSGAYAWAAPKKGTYTVSLDYTAGGSSADQDGVRQYAEDGVTVSINTSSGAVKSVNAPATSESNPNLKSGNLTASIKLGKGDMVYFIADPQANGSYATANFQIVITLTEESTEEDDADSGSGSGDSAGNGDASGEKPGGGASGKPNQNGSGAAAAPAVKPPEVKDETETVSESKYYKITAKTLEELTTDDEAADDEKDNAGGSGEIDDGNGFGVPVMLIGLIELVVGGAVVTAGRFFWKNAR